MRAEKRRASRSEHDFTESMLPHTRKEVFRDVMSLQWRAFICYGAIVLLAAMPLIILTVIEDSMIAEASRGFADMSDEAKSALIYEIYAIQNTTAVIKIPFIALLFTVLAGIVRLVRQHAYMKNVFFGLDFGGGFKRNGWQMLMLGILSGVLYAVSVVTFNISLTAKLPVLAVMFMLPTLFSVFVGIPMIAYSIPLIAVYNTSFIQILGTSLMITAKSPWRTVKAMSICLVSFIPMLLPNIYCHIIGGAVWALIFPITLLFWMLHSLDRFDEHINRERYPELVGIGTVD